jgi:hypothetical protein
MYCSLYHTHIFITTPVVSALKNYCAQSFQIFWIKAAVSEVKLKQPLRSCLRSKTVTHLERPHATAITQRTQVPVRAQR